MRGMEYITRRPCWKRSYLHEQTFRYRLDEFTPYLVMIALTGSVGNAKI